MITSVSLHAKGSIRYVSLEKLIVASAWFDIAKYRLTKGDFLKGCFNNRCSDNTQHRRSHMAGRVARAKTRQIPTMAKKCFLVNHRRYRRCFFNLSHRGRCFLLQLLKAFAWRRRVLSPSDKESKFLPPSPP